MNDLLEIYEREDEQRRAATCPVCMVPYDAESDDRTIRRPASSMP